MEANRVSTVRTLTWVRDVQIEKEGESKSPVGIKQDIIWWQILSLNIRD